MGDLISRQAAIEYLMTNMCWYNEDGYEETEDEKRNAITDLINGVPSAQQWISCSERLPDDLTEVNVTYVNHDPEPYYAFAKDKPFTASAVYYKGNWYWYSSTCADYLGEYGRNDVDKVDDAIEITAWMLLPDPYQEEERG